MSRDASERGDVLLYTRQACSARPVTKNFGSLIGAVPINAVIVLAL